jgi:hypothetical protein
MSPEKTATFVHNRSLETAKVFTLSEFPTVSLIGLKKGCPSPLFKLLSLSEDCHSSSRLDVVPGLQTKYDTMKLNSENYVLPHLLKKKMDEVNNVFDDQFLHCKSGK